MKIYSAETWTLEELAQQTSDAGRRTITIPAADTRKAVLEAFNEVLDFSGYDGIDFDALNDALHDLADTVADDDEAPVTVIWQVAPGYRADRSFAIICEILQDAESYAGRDLAVIAVLL